MLPRRLVRTLVFDVEPVNGGPAAVETITLEEVGAGTKVVHHTRFPWQEALDAALSQGMSKGVLEQVDRLAALLTATA
ncbi:hypothetical protein GCM10022214_32360 [Actinomadura miaoliensis]|uniref:Activator of Hsp90 ATPase homologue 1/2-like C-terminal domain-containing protein n=1 Tax=Actinomadura miaoliensis TaxID=430685 RepID=A0ABP7VT57_9ACTN